jgi:aspartyl-tRNA(Asn)/glutamyl-tRNA(Gln) amidotransferase subunit C
VLALRAMSRITRKDVERTAELARLSLSAAEIESMTHDLDRILDHVDQLQALDTQGIEPTAHAIPLATPLRADRPSPGIDPELALANAPLREATAFVVPKVIDGEES